MIGPLGTQLHRVLAWRGSALGLIPGTEKKLIKKFFAVVRPKGMKIRKHSDSYSIAACLPHAWHCSKHVMHIHPQYPLNNLGRQAPILYLKNGHRFTLIASRAET